MSDIRKIDKGTHPIIGRYVIVETRTWDGWNQRYVWARSLFPTDQSRVSMHPRHPTGFCVETGATNACVSPSASFYADLTKWAGFKWSAK